MTHPQHGDRNGPYIFDSNLNQWVLGGPAPEPARKKRRIWPWILVAVVALGVVVTALLPEGKGSDNDRMVALCQKLVVDESATPSTVTFISSKIETTTEGWLVSGEADGQNLFGAMVRERYACKVFYDEDKDLFSAAVVD